MTGAWAVYIMQNDNESWERQWCRFHGITITWRIGYESATSWGYDRDHTPDEIESFTEHYKSWMSAAFDADSCTVNGEKQIKMIEWMFGKKLPNCHTMCCGTDARYALALPEYERQNYMVTLSRLEPNKHVPMIAESLAILKNRGVDVPPWVILGYGSPEQVTKLARICEENALVVSMRECYGAEKWRWVRQSRLMLCGLMMWIPISEGIVCQTPVLAVNDQEVYDMYEDTIWWAKRNDPEDYADMIQTLLLPQNEYPREEIMEYGRDRLLDINRHGKNELYANTQERAAKKYSEIFMGEK